MSGLPAPHPPSPVDVDLVALSLLPVWCAIDTAAELRAGRLPRDVLERQLSARWPTDRGRRDTLLGRAAAALARAADRGLVPLTWSDARYPAALLTIVDWPAVLWMRGDADAFSHPAVAIVGSRAGSPYALAVAERLAADLASRGVAIVSGLARGVDSAAHRGAVSAPGATIAVLGSGADVIYPPEHAALAGEIAASGGAIVSELAPGTPPLKRFFPQRNRIISGIARAVVVVEAGERSGSLITARLALEQGRDVLAVPGNVLSGRNRGAHALLRDGAKIVETADDILEELGPPSGRPDGCRTGTSGGDPLLACLTPGEPADLDALAERSGLTAAHLLPRLLDLELQGLVGRIGGGRFVRFDRPC